MVFKFVMEVNLREYLHQLYAESDFDHLKGFMRFCLLRYPSGIVNLSTLTFEQNTRLQVELLCLCRNIEADYSRFVITSSCEGMSYVNWERYRHGRLQYHRYYLMSSVMFNLQAAMDKDFSVKADRDSARSILKSCEVIPSFNQRHRVIDDDFMDASVGYAADLWRQLCGALDFGDRYAEEEIKSGGRDDRVVAFRKGAAKLMEIFLNGSDMVRASNGIYTRSTFEYLQRLEWRESLEDDEAAPSDYPSGDGGTC